MASGLTRRETTPDSLAGRTEMQPVTLRGPSVGAPRAVTPPTTSATQQIAGQLGSWASKRLSASVNKQAQAAMLDGQIDHLQGKTFEDVEMGGNKFALEGYKLMEAQTLSSTMLAAQREEIAMGAHELDPATYRERLTARMEGMLEGRDPRTAELVREQLARHLPVLIADHTAQNMRYLEGKNYETLVNSIEVVSRDATATDQLVLFAQGGEGSPSAGLSDERRRSATVDGVIRAFDNDNPMAYAALAREGLLGEGLTTAQQNAIEAANQRFQNRRRSEYDKGLFDGEQAIMRKVEQGALNPSAAVEELSILYADHHIDMNAAEAGSIYNDALTSERQNNLTAAVNFEEAMLRGDYRTMAAITEPILITIESGGNPNAVSPVGAKGLMQVMDYTNSDPGFGIAPARDDSPEERVRVGKDYWRTMMGGSSAHGTLKWSAGDLEAAAVAYNAGPGVANKWIAAGRDDSVLPEETRNYKAKMVSGLKGWKAPTARHRLDLAQDRLTATRKRVALDTYERTEPLLNDLDNQYKNGELDRETWLNSRQEVYGTYNRARTEADVNHEVSTTNAVVDALRKEAEKADDADYKNRLAEADAAIAAAQVSYNAALSVDGLSASDIQQATAAFNTERNQILQDAGILISDRGDAAHIESVAKQAVQAIDDATEYRKEQVEVEAAIQQGFVSDLPKKLQHRAFEQIEKTVGTKFQTEVAEGRMSVEEAQEAMAIEFQQTFADAGMVDPRVSRRMNAAMQEPLLDDAGNPNPNVVATVQDYAQLKAMNPYASDTFFTNQKQADLAEAILDRAVDHDNVAEAVRSTGTHLNTGQHVENPKEYVRREDVANEIDNQVYAAFEERDIGPLHAIWQSTATWDQIWDNRHDLSEQMFTPEVQDLLRSQVVQEVSRMKELNPGLSTSNLVTRAMENVSNRVEVIGASVVPLADGQNIRQKMFGHRANDFKHDGDVNSAIVHWMRGEEFAQTYGWNEATASEYLPRWAQQGIDATVGLFGYDFEPAQALRGAISTDRTGVRPYRAMPTPNGKDIVLEVLKPDGNWSDPILLDLPKIGSDYLAHRRGQLTK